MPVKHKLYICIIGTLWFDAKSALTPRNGDELKPEVALLPGKKPGGKFW
jgi:hypothetical protein